MVSKRTDAGRLPVLVRWGRSVGRKASVTVRDYVAGAVRTSGLPPCGRFFGDARALPVRNKGPAGAVRGNRAKAAGGLLGSEASVRAYRALERRLPGGLSARASRVG